MRQLPQHVRPAARAGVETPDLAVIGTQIRKQHLQAVLLIGGERSFVVIPEWRSQQLRRRSGDGGNVSGAVGQRFLECLRGERAMVGVPMGRGMKTEDMPLLELASHDVATDFAVASPGGTRLDEKYRFDPRLHRVVFQAVKHRR